MKIKETLKSIKAESSKILRSTLATIGTRPIKGSQHGPQVEVCVNDQTIKNAQGGGGVKRVFDYMDERHNKVCLHERAS